MTPTRIVNAGGADPSLTPNAKRKVCEGLRCAPYPPPQTVDETHFPAISSRTLKEMATRRIPQTRLNPGFLTTAVFLHEMTPVQSRKIDAEARRRSQLGMVAPRSGALAEEMHILNREASDRIAEHQKGIK